nr:seed maturation protein [Tanacetum cinerariifolium]
MQTAKNAAAFIKETAANIGASAKSDMEKTKATLQEKNLSSFCTVERGVLDPDVLLQQNPFGCGNILENRTIKSILKPKSTLKAVALKGVIINEPSSAPAKDNKSYSASKVHSAPAGSQSGAWIVDAQGICLVSRVTRTNMWNNQDLKWCLETILHAQMKVMALYNVMFDVKKGTIFNFNKEIVMIAPRAFRVFNTRRQQTEETYHITFDEIPEAIKFLKPSVDNINIAKSERYPPDKYLHPYEPSQRYQTNINDVSFIEPYECPEPVVLETEVLSDQNEDTLAENTTSILSSPLHVPSMVTPSPQDKWSQDKHIELVNIIGNLRAGMLTRAMAKQLSVASAHECLFVDFLFEKEPKKVSEALKHPGCVDAMQDELN